MSFPETSIDNYQPTLRNNPEERSFRNSSVRTEMLCEKVSLFGVEAEIRAAASLVGSQSPAARVSFVGQLITRKGGWRAT